MKEYIIGFIFFAALIAIAMFFAGDNTPDLSSNGGYEPCRTSGHPLWTDC